MENAEAEVQPANQEQDVQENASEPVAVENDDLLQEESVHNQVQPIEGNTQMVVNQLINEDEESESENNENDGF